MKSRKQLNVFLPLVPAIAYFFVVTRLSDIVNIKLLLVSGLLCYLSGVSVYDSVGLMSLNHYRSSFSSLAASPLFLLAACLLIEWGLFSLRNEHFYLLMPELAMDAAPIIIMIAYMDCFHKKKTGKHSKIAICLYCALSVLFFLCALNYAFAFSYIFMDIKNQELYSYLSIAFMSLITIIGLEIILSPKNVTMINSLIVFSLLIRAAMNYEEYMSELLLRVIYAEHSASALLYFKAVCFSAFASYPVAILFALLFLGPVLNKSSLGNSEESTDFIKVRHTEDGFEIPPNVPSL